MKQQSNAIRVELREGTVKKKGNIIYDFYWHIYANDKRAGYVYINTIDDLIIGKHNSIHIYLNKDSVKKGIGSKGYAMACKQSGLNTIYAHMSKKNIASKKAATNAGFVEVPHPKFLQLVMKWEKGLNEKH